MSSIDELCNIANNFEGSTSDHHRAWGKLRLEQAKTLQLDGDEDLYQKYCTIAASEFTSADAWDKAESLKERGYIYHMALMRYKLSRAEHWDNCELVWEGCKYHAENDRKQANEEMNTAFEAMNLDLEHIADQQKEIDARDAQIKELMDEISRKDEKLPKIDIDFKNRTAYSVSLRKLLAGFIP